MQQRIWVTLQTWVQSIHLLHPTFVLFLEFSGLYNSPLQLQSLLYLYGRTVTEWSLLNLVTVSCAFLMKWICLNSCRHIWWSTSCAFLMKWICLNSCRHIWWSTNYNHVPSLIDGRACQAARRHNGEWRNSSSANRVHSNTMTFSLCSSLLCRNW
jgi:hypothetical protein